MKVKIKRVEYSRSWKKFSKKLKFFAYQKGRILFKFSW
jgi:hypothetical protein